MGTSQSVQREGELAHTIIESIADTTNVSPVDLNPPLYDVIDLEALERVFSEKSVSGEIGFHYNGCEVTVSSDGTVSVEPSIHQ